MAGVRTGGKGKRRARKAAEDRTRDARGRGPSPFRAHFDFPPLLRPVTQATLSPSHRPHCEIPIVQPLILTCAPGPIHVQTTGSTLLSRRLLIHGKGELAGIYTIVESEDGATMPHWGHKD